MKRSAIKLLVAVALVLAMAGCGTEEMDRVAKDHQSSIHGLNRTLVVYDQQGNEIKRYTGKFDIETNDYGNKIKFDLDGKRHIIYNATVIVDEE